MSKPLPRIQIFAPHNVTLVGDITTTPLIPKSLQRRDSSARYEIVFMPNMARRIDVSGSRNRKPRAGLRRQAGSSGGRRACSADPLRRADIGPVASSIAAATSVVFASIGLLLPNERICAVLYGRLLLFVERVIIPTLRICATVALSLSVLCRGTFRLRGFCLLLLRCRFVF